jgi:trans-AT polyketide synthase/acyltransferase/oxidoreductase domain-containing protein
LQQSLEILAGYGAAIATLVGAGEPMTDRGSGGGLALAVERHGVEPLVGLLWADTDLRSIELKDEDVSLELRREGGGARMTVSWASGESFTEELELAPHPGLVVGAAFLPEPGSRLHDLVAALQDPGQTLHLVQGGEGLRAYSAGRFAEGPGAMPHLGKLRAGPLGPAWFREIHGVKANYVAGAMAGGIASAEMVIAMGTVGYLAFYGSGGLPMSQVVTDVRRIKATLGDAPCGFNLLHNPVEPAVEHATVKLYLDEGCRWVSASAFMTLTPAIVRYRYTGIHEDASGRVVCPNRVFAKISRSEVAEHFLRPAPPKLLGELVAEGHLSQAEAELAVAWPMADAVTCEADSGGHTDRRALPVLLPIIKRQRDRIAHELGYADRGIRVALGAAGGIGTPESILAGYALGADYVLTGSVNQATLEAGTSLEAKNMLLSAGMADVASGPAPDMFELGAHVQVLSRGTMYANRGSQLYDIYKGYADWSEVPEKTRNKVEKQMLQRTFEEVWRDCEAYWGPRDARVVERAHRDGRHKMALVFRWYLGMSSRWARMGEASRKRDYQIWCGPAMGAFNDWVAGTPLEPLEARSVVTVAEALLDSAGGLKRLRDLEAQGAPVPAEAWDLRPS